MLRNQRFQRYPQIAEQLKYIDVGNAVQLTGVSASKLMRCVRDGILDVYKSPDKSGVFLYREQIISLDARLREKSNHVSKYYAQKYLGLRKEIFDELLQTEMIKMTGKHLFRKELKAAVCMDDLETFLDKLRARVFVQDQPIQDTLLLPKASILNGKVGIGMVSLLNMVVSGELKAYHNQKDLLPLNELSFREADICELTQYIKNENGWIDSAEVRRILHISPSNLEKWKKRGILVPVASFARATYYNREDVQRIRQRSMTTSQVAKLLGVSTGLVSAWTRLGYLEVWQELDQQFSRKHVYDRLYVEDWHSKYVTLPELKLLTNATDATVSEWRKQGKLTPTMHSNTSKFFFRDEVSLFQNEAQEL